MKISHLIFLSFLFILLLFSITTFINYRQAEKVNENAEWSTKSTVIIRQSNRFQRNILNMISGLRGYLFTGEPYFMQSYDSAMNENKSILNELSMLIPDSSSQEIALEEIHTLHDQWVNEFAYPLINAKKMAGTSDSSLVSFNRLYREKLVVGTEKNLNNRLQFKFRQFINYEYDIRDERKAVLAASIQRTKNISFYLTTLSIITGFAIAMFLAYRISSRILKMVKMANAIAAENYEVSMEDKGKDELSSLAHSLNHMAKVLSENISLLKRKNQELDQFAHIVSHDMKAPLRGIGNVVTWIEEDHSQELSPKVSHYIGLIKGRLVRAENLIQGILSYARIGKEDQTIEKVDVNQLIQEILENLSLRHGISLIVQPDLPILYTERLPLMQIFSNLISNAVKHHNKTIGSVKIYFKDNRNNFEFFVEDDGPGIEKIYHNKIFIIFQTLQERDEFESTGVGLAIVKKILDERKQEIKVVSQPGKGSIFSFTWPKTN